MNLVGPCNNQCCCVSNSCVLKRSRLFNTNARARCVRKCTSILDTEDVGFPYMMDARHYPDTLFLLAGSDFRFFESDCFGDEWLLLGSHTTAQRSDAAGEPQTGARALLEIHKKHALQVLTHTAF